MVVTAKPQYPCHECNLRVQVTEAPVIVADEVHEGQVSRVWIGEGGRVLVETDGEYTLYLPQEGIDCLPVDIRDRVAELWESLGFLTPETL